MFQVLQRFHPVLVPLVILVLLAVLVLQVQLEESELQESLEQKVLLAVQAQTELLVQMELQVPR